MRPSVGRIVHYNFQGEILPAIIVKVTDSSRVNLQVFMDYSSHISQVDGKSGPVPESRLLWVSGATHKGIYTTDEFLPGTWDWPPRVEA